MKVKMLTKAQEVELLRRWRNDRDEKARQQIIESHVPLAVKIARKMKGYGLPEEDLIQEGVIGIDDALKRFDETAGFRFNTFARWHVFAAIQAYVIRNVCDVRGSLSTRSDESFRKGVRKVNVPLDSQLPDGRVLMNTFIDDNPSPEEIVTIIIDGERRKKQINRALKKLPLRTRDIIRRRYLRDNSQTLNTIAAKYGISRERVRQIEQKALQDLRVLLTNEMSS